MDFTASTPAEIDSALVKAVNDRNNAAIDGQRAQTMIDRITSTPDSERKHYPWLSDAKLAEHLAITKTAEAEYRRANAIIKAADLEFDHRGGWTRYHLVLNTNGHVHSSTNCETCFPSTAYALLTEQSGMSPQDLVALAGEAACTSCFHWAPTSILTHRSRLEAPERKAARLQREADKAARNAKKLANGITTPDGKPLRGEYGTFNTARAAEIEAVDHLATDHIYGYTHPSRNTWLACTERIIEALAAKHNVPVEDERARIQTKAAAKIKRDERETAKHRF